VFYGPEVGRGQRPASAADIAAIAVTANTVTRFMLFSSKAHWVSPVYIPAVWICAEEILIVTVRCVLTRGVVLADNVASVEQTAQQLISRALAGEEAACRQLYDTHAGRVAAYFRRSGFAAP
jgi:hypothetical protein